MAIYEMFYLCTHLYFGTQKDMRLNAVVYTPTIFDVILHISFTHSHKPMTAKIEFDEDGEPK